MGSAASKFGSSLLASLAFSKFKSSSTFVQQQQLEQQPADLRGTEEAGASSAAAAAAVAAEVVMAAAEEEEAARQLTAHKSTPALGDSSGISFLADAAAGEAALSFGVLAGTSTELAPPHGRGTLSAETSDAAMSPQHPPQQLPLYRQGVLSPRAGAQQGHQPGCAGGSIARVADGPAAAGGKTAQGRLDFVMQVWCGVQSPKRCRRWRLCSCTAQPVSTMVMGAADCS